MANQQATKDADRDGMTQHVQVSRGRDFMFARRLDYHPERSLHVSRPTREYHETHDCQTCHQEGRWLCTPQATERVQRRRRHATTIRSARNALASSSTPLLTRLRPHTFKRARLCIHVFLITLAFLSKHERVSQRRAHTGTPADNTSTRLRAAEPPTLSAGTRDRTAHGRPDAGCAPLPIT